MGRSTVDDCVLFLARFKGGAVASFEATRLATGKELRRSATYLLLGVCQEGLDSRRI